MTFFLPYFCGDYFFHCAPTETRRFAEDQQKDDYTWIVQIKEELLEIVTAKLHQPITVGDNVPHVCGLPPSFLNVEL